MIAARTKFRLHPLGVVLAVAGCVACGGSDAGSSDQVNFNDAGGLPQDDADESPGGTDAEVVQTPLRYVVVIVKENHTLDNYFTNFPGANTTTTAKLHDGTMLTRPHAPDDMWCDLGHSHDAATGAYDNGKMDNFESTAGGDCNKAGLAFKWNHLPHAYYQESQIPNYWAYARNFVLADNFHSTLLGPTSPGHFAVVTGQTPFYGNSASTEGCTVTPAKSQVDAYNRETCGTRKADPCFEVPSIVDAFPKSKTWRAYGPGSGSEIGTPFNLVKQVGGNAETRKSHYRGELSILADLAKGDQANYTQVDVYGGTYMGKDISEHPPFHPCGGENFTVEIVNRIMNGPHWNETAILVTWDDWGGWYDHVKPALITCDYNEGFRLPLIIISPYAKKGYVLKAHTGHASIPRFIEDVFHMPRMSARDPHARDGTAGSLLDAFDFKQPPREPIILKTRACP